MEKLTVASLDNEEALSSSLRLLERSYMCRGNVPNVNPDETTVGRQLLLVLSVQKVAEALI